MRLGPVDGELGKVAHRGAEGWRYAELLFLAVPEDVELGRGPARVPPRPVLGWPVDGEATGRPLVSVGGGKGRDELVESLGRRLI